MIRTLNQRVPGSSPGAPTKLFKYLAKDRAGTVVAVCCFDVSFLTADLGSTVPTLVAARRPDALQLLYRPTMGPVQVAHSLFGSIVKSGSLVDDMDGQI